MANGAMPIGKYTLSRRVFTGPGAPAETVLTLQPPPGDTGQIHLVVAYFYAEPEDSELVNGNSLFVRLDADEFDLWYRILQTEDPVGLAWSTRDDDDTKVAIVVLYTGDEPPGEGFDSSP